MFENFSSLRVCPCHAHTACIQGSFISYRSKWSNAYWTQCINKAKHMCRQNIFILICFRSFFFSIFTVNLVCMLEFDNFLRGKLGFYNDVLNCVTKRIFFFEKYVFLWQQCLFKNWSFYHWSGTLFRDCENESQMFR